MGVELDTITSQGESSVYCCRVKARRSRGLCVTAADRGIMLPEPGYKQNTSQRSAVD